MVTNSTEAKAAIGRGHLALLLAATAMTYLLIVLGGLVCITDASSACPDWPGCYGRAVPPPQTRAIIEYTHRLVAALTTPLIVAAAVVGWRRARDIPWVSRPPLVAIAFVLAVIVFGALVVLRGLPRGLAALDLGSALTVLALMVTATVAAAAHRHRPFDRLAWRTPPAWLSLAALVAVLAVLVSGVLVAESGSVVRCLGWPQYGVHLSRDILAGVASLLVLGAVVGAWRQAPSRHWRPVPAVVGLLILATNLLAWLRPPASTAAATQAGSLPPDTAWLLASAALATALWAGLVALTLLSAVERSR